MICFGKDTSNMTVRSSLECFSTRLSKHQNMKSHIWLETLSVKPAPKQGVKPVST